MNKFLIFVLCLYALIACRQQDANIATDNVAQQIVPTNVDNVALIQAFQHKKSHVFVEGAGVVKKLLPDDNKGSRHQKFLVTISPEQTLLFAHNIDLAARIPLVIGDMVAFRGEYVYNPKGGVMHWTHRDPQGNIEGGWIRHQNQDYN
jgi:hypothetical protein